MTTRPVPLPAPTGSAVYVSTNARQRRAAHGWQPAFLTMLAAGAAAVAAATALTPLGLLAVPVGQLLLGAVFTGALLGIAGQQTLANFVAGIALLFTRTIAVGDRIRLHNGTLGGTFEGTITEIGLVHLHLRTTDTPLAIPNTQVLAGAIAVLDPEAAPPASPITRRPRSPRSRRRHHPITHTRVLRTTRVMPALTAAEHRNPALCSEGK
jgi:hypothetical protein